MEKRYRTTVETLAELGNQPGVMLKIRCGEEIDLIEVPNPKPGYVQIKWNH
jgi:hypothetical protein